jgi:uncharacterized protein affecting Mg2+/Co2+ transport
MLFGKKLICSVIITNFTETTYQLVSREWRISDGNQKLKVVKGEGVVGLIRSPIVPHALQTLSLSYGAK